jgi:predicted RNA-binding Zn ribbon-like protein
VTIQTGAAAPTTDDEAALQLLQDFVNTNDLEGDRDLLGTPQLLVEWLAQRGELGPADQPDAATHARAIAVREGVRALARANNDEALDETLVSAMNQAARSVALSLEVSPIAGDGEWRLRPVGGGIDGFTGRVLAAVACVMAAGTWSRVKACRNDGCRWLFYDRSRNRSGTWCTMAICGSRSKARAYRARMREAASA